MDPELDRTGTVDGLSPPARAFQAFERDGWNEVAPVYAEIVAAMQLTTGPAGAATLDAARVGPGDRVLDVACGPGFLAGVAARRGANVLGVDVSAAMVAEARRRDPSLRFEVGAAEALPVADRSVDAVVSAWGLPHFADHGLAFAEARRVLRPGGHLAMATWRPPPANELFAVLLGALAAHLQAFPNPPADLPPGPDMFRYADATVACADLAAAGFGEVSCSPLTFHTTLPGGGDDLLRFLRSGSVRSRALYRAVPPAVRADIDAAVLAEVERLPATPTGRRLRLEAVVVSARRV